MDFVLQQRLGWKIPIESEGKSFKTNEDLKVLCNDWPYGIDERIVHLVIWTKFVLEDDPETDDLTVEARKEIEEYVEETFWKRVGKENVSISSNHLTVRC